jgi:dihydroxy-acid dehydratase
MSRALKRWSAQLTEGLSRAGARAMMKAVGFRDEDLERPLVGVAHCWIEIMPCNYNHRRLAEKVKDGIRAAGGTPIEFNTIAISDGIAMGTEGMKASLVSREIIADSIELVARGHLLDALVVISGCDKTIPGTVMALLRLDLPGLMLYSGSIAPGVFRGRAVTIQDVFEAIGACAAGRMTPEELRELEDVACPGEGACGGQFTANTMATACEMLGIHRRRRSLSAADSSSWSFCDATSDRAISSRERPWRMPSRPSLRLAVRRTQSFICWPSRARRVWSWRSMTSIASARVRRFWPI